MRGDREERTKRREEKGGQDPGKQVQRREEKKY